jgi:hypothetical protein
VTVAVSIIAGGTAIAAWGELAFSMLGFIIMLTSGASPLTSSLLHACTRTRVCPSAQRHARGVTS